VFPTGFFPWWALKQIFLPGCLRQSYSPKCLEGFSQKFALTGLSEVVLLGSHPAAERRGPFGKGILHLQEKRAQRRNYDG
jgi:hypothetical protein